MPTTFTLPELPNVTFTVTRGADEDMEVPSNWLSITGIDNTTDAVVTQIGFAGP